jgi:hypothetical protein
MLNNTSSLKFELDLADEFLFAIGRITANFSLLEHILSFFISSLVQKDDRFSKFIAALPLPEYKLFTEFYISTRQGMEKPVGSRIGQIVASELAFRQKIDILSSLFQDQVVDASRRSELKKVLDHTVKAEAERNTVMHSLWTMSDNARKSDRIKVTAKKKAGYKLAIECLSVEQLEIISNRLAEVNHELYSLIIEFYA